MGCGITYLPMSCGFLYLVAVMDWHSRYVLAWRLSNTPRPGRGQALEAGLCAEALEEALSQGRPEVFHGEQEAVVGDSNERRGSPEQGNRITGSRVGILT